MSEKYFTAALRQVKQISNGSVISEKWESLYNNLGHTCRKLGKFEEALAFHRQALILKPQTASTYSAIGYVQTLQVRNLSFWSTFFHSIKRRRTALTKDSKIRLSRYSKQPD